MESEDLFDYGGIEVLNKMIYGDFQFSKMCNGMKEFYKINGSRIQNTEIFSAITDFSIEKNL